MPFTTRVVRWWSMDRSRKRGGVRRYLADVPRRAHAELDTCMRAAIKSWDAEGWAIIGTPPRLRVAVLVARKLARPRKPVAKIPLPRSLGGGLLKPAVIALHRDVRVDGPTSGDTSSPLPPGGGIDYLAPGVPVGWNGERIGIGAVIEIGSTPHVITCGHVPTSETVLTTADDDTEIGTLKTNYFRAADRLDAAVFRLNADGISLLRRGTTASSWCSSIRVPRAADNHEEATFWPTFAAQQSPFVEDVLSYAACVPGGVGCGYVMLTCCTHPGDSGSSLQLASSYYGLASLRDGNNSFFTPISEVRRRLEDEGNTVGIWRPS